MVVELALAAAGSSGPTAAGTRLDSVTAARRRSTATATIAGTIGSGPAGLVRRAAFHLVLENAQRYYALRENMRYHADFFLARMRQLALVLGADLAARGLLAAADDVFWLDADELAQADDGAHSMSKRVGERRRAAASDEQHSPPDTLVGATATSIAAPPSRVLTGEIGAPGRCQGRARLVRNPTDFERVTPGDILVAVYTDPGWIAVLERAAGLVLETGGLLSHGAIVARELGIPALVGVTGATRAIRDGDALDLDATTGHVTIV
jgi:pyruvate,water dikinase